MNYIFKPESKLFNLLSQHHIIEQSHPLARPTNLTVSLYRVRKGVFILLKFLLL